MRRSINTSRWKKLFKTSDPRKDDNMVNFTNKNICNKSCAAVNTQVFNLNLTDKLTSLVAGATMFCYGTYLCPTSILLSMPLYYLPDKPCIGKLRRLFEFIPPVSSQNCFYFFSLFAYVSIHIFKLCWSVKFHGTTLYAVHMWHCWHLVYA